MTLLKILLGAVVIFGGFVALMYLAQRSLMYFPERARTPPATTIIPAKRNTPASSTT